MYSGYPDPIHIWRASAINCLEWVQLCQESSIDNCLSGTKSHNLHGKGETYSSIPWRVFHTIRKLIWNFQARLDHRLSWRSWTKQPVQTSWFPLWFILVGPTASHTSQSLSFLPLTTVFTAQREFTLVVAKCYIQTVLYHKTSVAHKLCFAPGHFDLVYCEKQKYWTSPHLVSSVKDKAIYVELDECSGARKFDVSGLKPTKLPSISGDFNESDPPLYLHPNSPLPKSINKRIHVSHFSEK